MEKEKNIEQNLVNNDKLLDINHCPKCGCMYIYDIGYDNWQCGNDDCNYPFRKKSKTGLEEFKPNK